MMREAGVSLLLHAYFLSAQVEGESRRGRDALRPSAARATYRAPVVIDATADALVAASAGVPTQQGDERGRVQPATLIFRAEPRRPRRSSPRTCASIPTRCARSLRRAAERTARRAHRGRGALRAVEAGARGRARRRSARARLVLHLAVSRRGHGQHDARRRHRSARSRRSHARRGRVAPAGDAAARVLSRARPGFRKRAHRGDRHAESASASRGASSGATRSRATTSAGAQVRRCGRAQRISDRLHNPSGSGTTTQRLAPGESYEIPYRCLVPVNREQLLVAGRCISTTHEALASTRLTPTVMTLGQAAGTAAALACARGARVGDVDTRELRAQLDRRRRSRCETRACARAFLRRRCTLRGARRLGRRASCARSTIRRSRRFGSTSAVAERLSRRAARRVRRARRRARALPSSRAIRRDFACCAIARARESAADAFRARAAGAPGVTMLVAGIDGGQSSTVAVIGDETRPHPRPRRAAGRPTRSAPAPTRRGCAMRCAPRWTTRCARRGASRAARASTRSSPASAATTDASTGGRRSCRAARRI